MNRAFDRVIHGKKLRAIETSVWLFLAAIGAIAALWLQLSGARYLFTSDRKK